MTVPGREKVREKAHGACSAGGKGYARARGPMCAAAGVYVIAAPVVFCRLDAAREILRCRHLR